jgi:dihydroorotase
MSGVLIRDGRVIDPASGFDETADVRIADGVIVEIGAGLEAEAGEEIVDATGRVVAPALIDLRARACEPGDGAPESLDVTARAAAAGGIGTLVLAPDSGDGVRRPEDIELIEARSLALPVRMLVAGLAVDGDGLAEIGLMLRAGAAYVGDGGAPIADAALARRALAYAGGFDAWASLRPEEASLATGTVAHESDMSVRLGLAVRPGVSEAIAARRDSALAELTGAQLIFDRVTTAAGLDQVRAARRQELEVAATAPVTHLMFNEVDAGGLDPRYRLDPPLRGQADREALIAAIADGTIDAVVSDHAPVPAEAKDQPFAGAAPGSANLEALLPELCALVAEGRLDLVDALRVVTSGPADILGLEQGRIAEGTPADILVFDPDAPNVYGKHGLVSRAPSAFEGRRLHGRVLHLFVEGAIILQSED